MQNIFSLVNSSFLSSSQHWAWQVYLESNWQGPRYKVQGAGPRSRSKIQVQDPGSRFRSKIQDQCTLYKVQDSGPRIRSKEQVQDSGGVFPDELGRCGACPVLLPGGHLGFMLMPMEMKEMMEHVMMVVVSRPELFAFSAAQLHQWKVLGIVYKKPALKVVKYQKVIKSSRKTMILISASSF